MILAKDELDIDVTTEALDVAGLKSIATKIQESGMVGSSDILSIEAMIGGVGIPNRLKNSITSAPSTHGVKSVLNTIMPLIKNSAYADSYTMHRYILTVIDMLIKQDIDSLIRILRSDLAQLSRLYLPKSIREVLSNDIKTASGILVTEVSSVDINRLANINSVTLNYLGRLVNSRVEYGLTNILTSCDDFNAIYSSVPAEPYIGDIYEYITRQISALSSTSQSKLECIREQVAGRIDALASLGYNGGDKKSQINLKMYNSVVNDKYLYSVVASYK